MTQQLTQYVSRADKLTRIDLVLVGVAYAVSARVANEELIQHGWDVSAAVASIKANHHAILIKYDGATVCDWKLVRKENLDLFPVGSRWAAGDGSTSYTVTAN